MDPQDIPHIEKLFEYAADRPLFPAGQAPHRRAEQLKPRQFWRLIQEAPIFYQPLGTIEYHERCNPLGVDAFKAWGVCQAAADVSGGIVLPPLYWGLDTARRKQPDHPIRYGMNSTAGFRLPGTTFVIRDETFHALLTDIVAEAGRAGCQLLVLLTGHNGGPQEHMIRRIARECADRHSRPAVYATNDNELLSLANVFETLDGRHGGLYETLLAEAVLPGTVDLEELPPDVEEHCCGGRFTRDQFDTELGRQLLAHAGELVGQQVRTRLEQVQST